MVISVVCLVGRFQSCTNASLVVVEELGWICLHLWLRVPKLLTTLRSNVRPGAVVQCKNQSVFPYCVICLPSKLCCFLIQNRSKCGCLAAVMQRFDLATMLKREIRRTKRDPSALTCIWGQPGYPNKTEELMFQHTQRHSLFRMPSLIYAIINTGLQFRFKCLALKCLGHYFCNEKITKKRFICDRKSLLSK